jgi:hypothetical protein
MERRIIERMKSVGEAIITQSEPPKIEVPKLVKDPKKVKMGKKSRAAGGRFELSVRKDLEKKEWIVDKWTNNVEFETAKVPTMDLSFTKGKLIPAKRKYRGPGIPMSIGTGFPDFIAYKMTKHPVIFESNDLKEKFYPAVYDGENVNYAIISGVESKMDGRLDKEEKIKCKWLL